MTGAYRRSGYSPRRKHGNFNAPSQYRISLSCRVGQGETSGCFLPQTSTGPAPTCLQRRMFPETFRFTLGGNTQRYQTNGLRRKPEPQWIAGRLPWRQWRTIRLQGLRIREVRPTGSG